MGVKYHNSFDSFGTVCSHGHHTLAIVIEIHHRLCRWYGRVVTRKCRDVFFSGSYHFCPFLGERERKTEREDRNLTKKTLNTAETNDLKNT